jgi:hypothetical protein
MTIGSHTVGIYEFGTDNLAELYDSLELLPQHFPIRLLRKLRESVYELALTTIPTTRIHVLDFESDNDLDKIEVVVGIGMMEKLAEKGYKQFSRRDLIGDMLVCCQQHDGKRLLEQLIPTFFKASTYTPIYYPLYLAGALSPNGELLNSESVPDKARELISGTLPRPYGRKDFNYRVSQTFRELLSEKATLAENYGLGCSYDIDDVIALQSYLVEGLEGVERVPTGLARLACKFDQLVFGPFFVGSRSELWKALGFEPC